ncbi:MAG: lysophospholipid acyltransferase family protein [Planctomycetota bacterium]|nr:lysophospholipid acyltransferase family protein [Planctomycetota bacterium]MDA1162120.1 lysophospholipid acyltransferase family protein [Planctomycetota bacterium]
MKIKSPLIAKLAAWLLVRGIQTLYLTVRREEVAIDEDTVPCRPNVRGRYLFCTWHDTIVMPLFHGPQIHTAGMVSGHEDGSLLAEAMHFLNVKPVRGSSGKRGVKALREAISVAQDYHITITPDGPRGPRRVMKDGIVFLAAKSGRPIVPLAYRVSRFWRITGNWTDLVIPKPFSKVTAFLDRPIYVPESIGREDLARITQEIQQRLDAMYLLAETDSTDVVWPIEIPQTRTADAIVENNERAA